MSDTVLLELDPVLAREFNDACADFDAARFAEGEARQVLARLSHATEVARGRKLQASYALERAVLAVLNR